MDLRKRLFIIISVVVLFILAITIFLLIPERDEIYPLSEDMEDDIFTDETDILFEDDTLDLPSVIGDPSALSSILSKEEPSERYVRQLAIDFVERFGSFSNKNRNVHINDVLSLVTDDMAKWIKTQTQAYGNEYKGSTTNVIVSDVEDFTETTATIHVEAQQVLETQTTVERVYNIGTVTLTLVDNRWKISGLFWE